MTPGVFVVLVIAWLAALASGFFWGVAHERRAWMHRARHWYQFREGDR